LIEESEETYTAIVPEADELPVSFEKTNVPMLEVALTYELNINVTFPGVDDENVEP